MVGGALLGAAANRQVCPTISEMTFGNQSRNLGIPFLSSRLGIIGDGARTPSVGRHGRGVQSSTRCPSLSRRYAAVCFHGMVAGSLTEVAPAFTARSYNAGTSDVTNAISTPSGALSKEAATTSCFKCSLAI